jgi:hypothetical protein
VHRRVAARPPEPRRSPPGRHPLVSGSWPRATGRTCRLPRAGMRHRPHLLASRRR